MSNYDRKLWERLCKTEEPVAERVSNPDWDYYDKFLSQIEIVGPYNAQEHLDAVRGQPRTAAEVRAATAGPTRLATFYTDEYLRAVRELWTRPARSIFDERAEEYRRHRALDELETAHAAPRIRWSLSREEAGRLRESLMRSWFGPTQPIDP